MQRPTVLRQQNQARPLQPALKQGSSGNGTAGRAAGRVTWRLPLLPVAEEGVPCPPASKDSHAIPAASHDLPLLSKLNSWGLAGAQGPSAWQQPPAAAAAAAGQHAEHPQPAACCPAAVDVALLVRNALAKSSLSPSSSSSSTTCATGAAPSSGSLEESLRALANPAVLALATDCLLAELLHGLQHLLKYSRPTRQWATPALASLLWPLQWACQERLRRTTLPCDATLAGAAACFFGRVIRQAGPGVVADGLLASAAAFARDNCRLLSGEVLANLLFLLATARFQPADPVTFGNRCIERVLRLKDSKAGLQLSHFADAMEALAQLRCIDARSAGPAVQLAVSTSRSLEEGQHLAVGQLGQLARIMQSVAIIAATATVPPPTLLAATAAWHLLVVRAEALAQEQEQAAPGGQLGSPHLGLALSRMWCASKMLMAVVKANSAPSFRLPDRLGMASHAAFLEKEQRTSSSGLTSAQRRVLAALSALKVSSNKIFVNTDFLDSVFQISVAVRMQVKSSGEVQRIAILIRDPHRQLLANGGPQGAALGACAAQECLLKAAGWQVVCLESQSCLCLPVATLAEELGALMMGATEASSLRFAA